MDSKGAAAQHGARGDAQGCPVGVLGGQSVGDPLGALPTQPRRGDVAVGRPRPGAHMPAVGGVQIARGLQMLGDQRRVLISRGRVSRLDRGGHPPVQFGAIRFELRFVGHRTDQRMMKDILGLAGEPDLIDKFGCHQSATTGSTPSAVSRSRPNRDPMTAAALKVRLA